MALKLKRVELFNIRSHGHVIFEPEDEGITTISGPNGSGKSTIVDSIAWALYGTKPQGVSKVAEIFKSGIGDKDKAYAIVDIELDGQPLRIERRRVSKGGAVECEISEITGSNSDGTPKLKNLAGPAVSHAEIFIRRNMKMDEKGFLAAILVQQKQVDQLISATPRERGAVIERLTGIAAITAGLVAARQDYNLLRKAAAFSSLDPLALGKLTELLETTQEELTEKRRSNGELLDQMGELKEIGKNLNSRYEEEGVKREKYQAAEQRLTTASVRLEGKNEDFITVNTERAALKKTLSALGSGTSLEDMEPQLAASRKKTRDLEREHETAEADTRKLTAALADARKVVGSATRGEIEAALATAETSHATHFQAIEDSRSTIIALRSESEKLATAIGIISHGESCPTCLQVVADPATVTAALEASKGALERQMEELATGVKLLVSQIADDTQTLETEKLRLASVVFLEENSDRLELLRAEEGRTGSELRVSESELQALERVFRELTAQEERRANYDRLLARAKTLTADIEKLETEKSRAQEELDALSAMSPARYASLKEKLEAARRRYASLGLRQKEVSGEVKLLEQRLEHTEERIAQERETIKKHENLMESVEDAAAAVEVLSEFREERVRTSIPVLEVYASDLINRFTEGKFTRLKMDGKFNTSVVLADGTTRSVGLLSGGELSAASMALRLAISMLLNSGGSQNLIILDEVLVSQDAYRVELILSTVREVCRGQVVLIAHNDSIDAVADKVVTLAPTNR